MAERIAIITGASSGLGREFIKQLDLLGEDLFPAEEDGLPVRPFDAFWVIARRKDRLEELAEGTKTPVRVLPCDLTDKKAVSDLAALLEKEQPDVRLLINAAGFGKIGSWRDIPLEQGDLLHGGLSALPVPECLCGLQGVSVPLLPGAVHGASKGQNSRDCGLPLLD